MGSDEDEAALTCYLWSGSNVAEKAFEHHMKQHFIFVNLQKAYDSIPCVALWTALKKLGVPDLLVDIIRLFHSNMEARIRVDGEFLEEIEVNNGLRQGCMMAPCLTCMPVWWLRSGQRQYKA